MQHVTAIFLCASVLSSTLMADHHTSKSKDSTAEQFRQFGELLVGRWSSDVTLIADWPGEKHKKGEKLNGFANYRWIQDQSGIEWTGMSGSTSGTTLITYDIGSKKIRAFNVGSAGGHWQTEIWKSSDTEWAWKITNGCDADGKKMEGEGSWQFKSDGTHVIQGKLLLDGEELPKLHNVYTRLNKN